jgi:sugar phosphate isomerase/epimerase
MSRSRIGIRLESLKLPLRRALEAAERLGVGGVQFDAVGDLGPSALSQTGRRELRHLVGSRNLEWTALGCPLRHGLDMERNQEQRIEHIKNVLALSFELGARLVVSQAGRIPPDPEDPGARLMSEALLGLGQYGDRVGAVFALETGLESGEVLAAFLDRFDTGSLGVNFDPANLLMNGFDPLESGRALRRRIRQVHAKDARLTGASRTAQEVPLGRGELDWMSLLGLLEEVDYRGWFTIEREAGDQPAEDVALGVAFLRRLGV